MKAAFLVCLTVAVLVSCSAQSYDTPLCLSGEELCGGKRSIHDSQGVKRCCPDGRRIYNQSPTRLHQSSTPGCISPQLQVVSVLNSRLHHFSTPGCTSPLTCQPSHHEGRFSCLLDCRCPGLLLSAELRHPPLSVWRGTVWGQTFHP
ncbi:hypothetical protein EGW08_001499 [Elysia chlorotica]|uniref:Uncharacterized protein n=1 Tax=Elysia chlorotica TaxID=188477 RepID=A0A3S1BSS6_ELYCH|nr:hypothetical protein EGW08_001499 [Elysia chlorotica]